MKPEQSEPIFPLPDAGHRRAEQPETLGGGGAIEILRRERKRGVFQGPGSHLLLLPAWLFLNKGTGCQHTHLLSICRAADFMFSSSTSKAEICKASHCQRKQQECLLRAWRHRLPPVHQRCIQDSCLTQSWSIYRLPFLIRRASDVAGQPAQSNTLRTSCSTRGRAAVSVLVCCGLSSFNLSTTPRLPLIRMLS